MGKDTVFTLKEVLRTTLRKKIENIKVSCRKTKHKTSVISYII